MGSTIFTLILGADDEGCSPLTAESTPQLHSKCAAFGPCPIEFLSNLEKMSRNKTNTRTGLARALSKLGYCSRSTAAKLIGSGQVRLNGRVVRDPECPVSLGTDRILVDGNEVGPAKKIYLMMNKPRGIVASASDEKGRGTVYSLLPEYRHWLAPVGRLDQASEGLLLFTNDSQWAARITAPETNLDKTYHVQIGTVPEENLLHRLISGVRSTEGDLLKAKRAAIVRHGRKNCWLEIVLDEGKNRHIRRMLSTLGIEVLRLVRIAIGPLHLGDLPKGSVRELMAQEKKMLDGAIGADENLPSPR
jgi:23S rRNA pseudouridine2605 synthase